MAKRLSSDETDLLYGRAEKVLGQTAKAMLAQALLAYEERRSNDAMRVLSFVWGRNARHIARAVVRWPMYFMPYDNVQPPDLEPDEFQVLFMLAALPLKAAEDIRRKWKQYTWRAWKVREVVEDWRQEQRDPALLKYRGKGTVLKVEEYAGDTQLTITVPNGKNKPKPGWKGRKVAVSLTEAKES